MDSKSIVKRDSTYVVKVNLVNLFFKEFCLCVTP